MSFIFTRIFSPNEGNQQFAVEESMIYEWAEFNLPVAQDLLVLRNQMGDRSSPGSAV
jgi:hypothetical protein